MASKLTINENGPLKVEGEFTIVDKEGNEYAAGNKPAIFLCRCGQTAKPPFCDGAHKACNFESPSKAF